MSRIMSTLFAIFAAVFVTSANPSSANADLAPELWHCTSQSNCTGALSGTDDSLTFQRKGEIKGIVSTLGTGDGVLSIVDGKAIVNRFNTQTLYIYDIYSGAQCEIALGVTCYQATIMNNRVWVACDNNDLRHIAMNCTGPLHC